MSNYISKTKIRWIATECTDCGAKDEAVDFALAGGHTPTCDKCGGPMKIIDKGDHTYDKA